MSQQRQPLEIRTERMANMAHGPMVYALSAHCLRLGAVVLDLHEDGKGLEAMPTVRSLYESALTAVWLAQSREAPAALFNQELRQRRALSRDLAQTSSAIFQQGAQDIAHINDEDLETIANQQARHFDQLCETLQPGGRHAYVLYRAMSPYAHPSSTLMDHYMTADERAPSGVVLNSTPDPIAYDTWLFLAVASMLWSARALDMMHRDSPNRSYLRGVARQLEITDAIQLTPKAQMEEQMAAQKRKRSSWRGRKPKNRNLP